MKKLLLLSLIFVIALSSLFSVSAQDDEGLPACSLEDITASVMEMAEGFAGFEEMMAMPDEPTASDITTAVVMADAFAYGYWEGLYEAFEEGICLENWWWGYTTGLALDEVLVVSQLGALTAHEAEAGNEELADILLELTEERSAMLEESMTGVVETMTALLEGGELDMELPLCTEEELEETYAGLEEIATVYAELGEFSTEATGEDLSALIVGYATLSSSYWNEVFPLAPACFEANDAAFNVGIIIDESLIVMSNLRLAEIQSDMGDSEVAELLAESAVTRAEELEALVEEYFAEEEM